MNLVVIGCVQFLIFLNFVLAQAPADGETPNSNAPLPPHEIQLKKFSELHHGLRSGPIIVVNKNTFFVPNLHYDGLGPDAHFWVGNGTMPDKNGTQVPDENGSDNNLKAYNGENVYITLPDNLTVDSIEYFGLWCIEYTQNFGHITIPKNLNVPDSLISINRDLIRRVQKCCPIDQSMDLDYKCVMQNQPFVPEIDIRMASTESLKYIPFINNIQCSTQGKSLEKVDDINLFLNGSISKNNFIWNQDEYCLETCNVNNEINPMWKTTAVVCKTKEMVPTDRIPDITPPTDGVSDISSISLTLHLFILLCKIILF